MSQEFYGSIKVDDGVRRIKVNEDGEFLSLSVNDVTLFDRFADLADWFYKKQTELSEYGNDFDTRHAQDEDEAPAVLEAIRKRTEIFRECCTQIDHVFGKDCCRKVFGGILPDEDLIGDFLEQMSGIIEKMAEERGEKLRARYSRARQGSRKKQRTRDELIDDYRSGKKGGN